MQELVRFRRAIEDTHLITDTYSYPIGQTLGLNGLMISETDDLTATIILDTPTDDYEEVKTHLSNVRRILEFFILSTRNIEVDYLVCGETDFILGENRLGYNMNL